MISASPIRSLALSLATLAFAVLGTSIVVAQDNFVNDPFAQTAAGASGKVVTATLVSEVNALRPGETVTVALKMVHRGPWHTYWKNPGTGQATRITWDLPEGLTAGPIQWPVPKPKKDIIGTSNIYGGTIYLLTDIDVAETVADRSSISIKAKANWLQCDEICTPGKAELSLQLPVVSKGDELATDQELHSAFNKVRMQQPVTSDLLKVDLKNEGAKLVVTLTPAAESNADPGNVHVFHVDSDALVEPAASAEKQGKSFIATFERSEESDALAQLQGFAFAENGWDADGKTFSIKLPGGSDVIALDTSTDAEDSPVATSAAEKTVESKSRTVLSEVTPGEKEALETVVSWGKKALGGKQRERTLLLALIFAFIGGLILNLMPCVFPVLGIKIMGFVNQSGEDSGRIRKHGLAFGAGVLFSMWVLVAALLIVKVSTSGTIVWGEQLRQPWFVAAMIGVIFAFGLSLAGLFEFGTSLTTAGGQLQNKKGYSGSFFSGLLTVLIASPCTGPFMAPAISYAFEQSAAQTFLIFTILGLGLASPYIILSFFPALIQRLPKPGAWMETFKQFMAFPMLATVVWLVGVFGKQMGTQGVVQLLVAMLALAFGLWIFGRYGTPLRKPGMRWAARGALLLTFASSVFVVNHSIQNRKFPEVALDSSGQIELHGMKWEPLSLERLVEHRKKGRTVFIDFTADW